MNDGVHLEIERRFLVRSGEWRSLAEPQRLLQGYLNTAPARTVRVRVQGDRAWLTVKGPGTDVGRTEIECEIPAATGRAIIEHPARLCVGTPVDKRRSRIDVGGLTWEVDEFAGMNAGLIIAEVEYDGRLPLEEWHSRIDADRPAWVGPEITGMTRFANSALTKRPFTQWPVEERTEVLRMSGSGRSG